MPPHLVFVPFRLELPITHDIIIPPVLCKAIPPCIHNHIDFSTKCVARLENQHNPFHPSTIGLHLPFYLIVSTTRYCYYDRSTPTPLAPLYVRPPTGPALYSPPNHSLSRTEHAVGNVVEGSRHAPRHADAVGAEYAEHQQRHGEEDDVGVQARPRPRDVATEPDQPRQEDQP